MKNPVKRVKIHCNVYLETIKIGRERIKRQEIEERERRQTEREKGITRSMM